MINYRRYAVMVLVAGLFGVIATFATGCADKSNFDARALFDRHERHPGGSAE